MIQLNSISKRFASHDLFDGLSLEIGAKSRIGLIGRNGCGKSTLLKIIMDQVSPDGGSIYRSPGLRINYLSQEPRITPHLTLEAEMRGVFSELNQLAEEETELINRLNLPDQSEEQQLTMAHRLDAIHQALERLDARSVDARIGRILKGLGFSLADHQRLTGEFSGGWQMRINLAKVLLEGADILLLDEPTNHLDLEACEWLENFLTEYPGGLVIVSHDRTFLDQVTTETAELSLGRLTVWPGNYSTYLTEKETMLTQMAAAQARQQKELDKQTAFVERFRASATRSTQAKSREKQLAKVERIELPEQDNRRMAMRFPSPKPSGRDVLSLRRVSKAFGDKPLFENLQAELERHQRVFLLGANGCGKTTLLRLILGLESPDAGEIRLGHQVITGYFSQNQLDTLDPKLSVFDTMLDAVQHANLNLNNTELRTLLGRFLFTQDEVFKPVSVLSGGEKSKLALARLMMSGPNTLLLDEPTNHMDISAKEVMTEALLEYDGSILCISHDRYFIRTLATQIWDIYQGHLIIYCGGYDYYRSKRDELREQVLSKFRAGGKNTGKSTSENIEISADLQSTSAVTTAAPSSRSVSIKEVQKQLNKTEKQIMTLEAEVAALETQMNDPALQQDYRQLQELSTDISSKQALLDDLNATWATLAETLSNLSP